LFLVATFLLRSEIVVRSADLSIPATYKFGRNHE